VRAARTAGLDRRRILAWPLALAAACDRPAAPSPPVALPAPPPPPPRRSFEDRAFGFDARFFVRKRPPGPGDWLAHHQEPQQSFFAYERGPITRPTQLRRTLVLQPVGPFSPRDRTVLDRMATFAGIYFASPVRVEAPLPLPAFGTRLQQGGKQYQTGALLDRLLLPRLPKDALAYLGVTTADLYLGSWNFAFGEGRFAQRIGVYSLHRYTPEFAGKPPSETSDRLLLERGYKVLAHETGHMLSIFHCQRFECLMNGVNHLGELDRSLLWFCHICLRKLHFNLGFDLPERYRKLAALLRKEGFPETAAWAERRLVVLQG
jgi:archaemetzincin